jgi:methylated-DNA-[protein]-cysteine S-methyltransferase
MYYSYVDTPLGRLLLVGTKAALVGLYFADSQHTPPLERDWINDDTIFAKAKAQLAEYFEGHRKAFDLPLEFTGTDFQKSVWRELSKIPYGQSISYGEIAKAIGRPKAVRAVGTAVGRNPLCLVGPCHRVLATGGGLGGYAGGIDKKKQLLKLEGIAVT